MNISERIQLAKENLRKISEVIPLLPEEANCLCLKIEDNIPSMQLWGNEPKTKRFFEGGDVSYIATSYGFPWEVKKKINGVIVFAVYSDESLPKWAVEQVYSQKAAHIEKLFAGRLGNHTEESP